jgi:hypothetical protein
MRMDRPTDRQRGRTDMTMLIVAFLKFGKAPKETHHSNPNVTFISISEHHIHTDLLLKLRIKIAQHLECCASCVL